MDHWECTSSESISCNTQTREWILTHAFIVPSPSRPVGIFDRSFAIVIEVIADLSHKYHLKCDLVCRCCTSVNYILYPENKVMYSILQPISTESLYCSLIKMRNFFFYSAIYYAVYDNPKIRNFVNSIYQYCWIRLWEPAYQLSIKSVISQGQPKRKWDMLCYRRMHKIQHQKRHKHWSKFVDQARQPNLKDPPENSWWTILMRINDIDLSRNSGNLFSFLYIHTIYEENKSWYPTLKR